MVEAGVPLKAAQERMGHSRPNILLKYYAHVLDESADVPEDRTFVRLDSNPSSRISSTAWCDAA
jgi:integrase